MPGSWPQHELPLLTTKNCKITSNPARRYNCLAWAAGEDFRNWWPDPTNVGYWPEGVPREETIPAFVSAYETRGFRLCVGGELEPGFEKIAIYGKNNGGVVVPTHAALQLPSGEWTSKLGRFEDIIHSHENDVNGPTYGTVRYYMSRPIQSTPASKRATDTSDKQKTASPDARRSNNN